MVSHGHEHPVNIQIERLEQLQRLKSRFSISWSLSLGKRESNMHMPGVIDRVAIPFHVIVPVTSYQAKIRPWNGVQRPQWHRSAGPLTLVVKTGMHFWPTGRVTWNSSIHWLLGELDYINVKLNLHLLIGNFRSTYDNAIRWLTIDLADYTSTLDQVIAWCRQATSEYLNQWCLRCMSPSWRH